MNLGLDRFPKIDFPVVTVTTRLPGSASEEVETEITDKIEEAVNTTSGIEELRSVSSEGISQVFITFVLEKDADVAAQEVRDKVNRVLPDLPKDIEQPFVEKFDPDSMPVMTIAVSAPDSPRDLTEYCDKVLRRQLESLSGVGQVMIVGGQKRQINIHLDPLKLRSHRLAVNDVAKALGSQNLQVPGGTVKSGQQEFTLRTMGRVTRMSELEQLTVASHNGHTITIADLGSVEDGAEEVKSLARFNDTPAVLLNVRKQSGTNTVEVCRLLSERLEELQKLAPPISALAVGGQPVAVHRGGRGYGQRAPDPLAAILAAVVILLFFRDCRTTLSRRFRSPRRSFGARSSCITMGFTLNIITLLGWLCGGHRDRRRDGGAREHLPLHRGKRKESHGRRQRRPRKRSAWPCSPPPCRWWPCSCRSPSWAGSSAAFLSFGVTMCVTIGESGRQLLADPHAGPCRPEIKRTRPQGGGPEPAAKGSADAHHPSLRPASRLLRGHRMRAHVNAASLAAPLGGSAGGGVHAGHGAHAHEARPQELPPRR